MKSLEDYLCRGCCLNKIELCKYKIGRIRVYTCQILNCYCHASKIGNIAELLTPCGVKAFDSPLYASFAMVSWHLFLAFVSADGESAVCIP